MNLQHVKTYKGHKDAIYKVLPFGEHYFLSGSGDGYLVKWAVEGAENPISIAKAAGGIYSIERIGDDFVAFGTNNGHLHIVNHRTKELIKNLQLGSPTQAIFDLAYSAKQDQLYCTAFGGAISVVNTQSWEVEQQIKVSPKNLRSLGINPSKTLLVAAGSDNQVYTFSLPDLKLISTLSGHSSSIFTAVFKNEVEVLTGARDAHLKHWDVIERTELSSLPAHLFTINEIAFSPDLMHFVTASRDKSIKLWKTEGLELLKVVERNKGIDTHTHSVNTIAWLGEKIITGGDDRKILVWDILTK